jgi:hypothetical protein
MEIIGILEMLSDESHAYMHKDTGELIIVSDEELLAAEEEDSLDDFPDWQKANIATAKEIISSDNYVALPDQCDIHVWQMMKDFCGTVSDEAIGIALMESLHGQGAFRRFKDMVCRHGIEKQWYEFKNQAYRRIVEEWCVHQGFVCQAG